MSTSTLTSPRGGAPTYSPSTGRQLIVLATAMLRGFFRDRTALFFTFFFPLMFLVLFGLIFGNTSTTKADIAVVGSGPIVSHLPGSVLNVKHFDSAAKALAAVRAGDIPAVLIERGNNLTLRFAQSDAVQAATIQGIVGAVVDQSNVAATGQKPTFALRSSRVEDKSLKAIQFLTPGILSWGVATSAAFGAALTLVSWRKKQLLRRIRLSPAPVWTVLGARVGVSIVVALVQALVFVGVAVTPLFGLKLPGSVWLALPLLVAGTLSFLSIGLLVGAIAKTEEAASAMANFIVLPMAFLSGSFFNIDGAPLWLRAVSKVFPLRWMNDGMLDVIARGRGGTAILAPMGVLLGFAAVLTIIASRIFSWDEA